MHIVNFIQHVLHNMLDDYSGCSPQTDEPPATGVNCCYPHAVFVQTLYVGIFFLTWPKQHVSSWHMWYLHQTRQGRYLV